jgi:seryl-tRNA synthetase
MRAEDFRRNLLEVGLLEDGGVAGLYHRSFEFEKIVRSVETYISAAGSQEKNRQLYFTTVMARSTLVGSGYLTSFPNLTGTIFSFAGNERDLPKMLERVDEGGDWDELLSPTEVALCSAACHSVYPLVSGTKIPTNGMLYEVQAFCFRHEPSDDPARMQSFRQHEFVYVGTAQGAGEHRDKWLARGFELLAGLGLTVEIVEANDPFFGRAGQLLAAGQRDKKLKYEIVAPITSELPGAISSANYHEDHFGISFGLSQADGSVAHTACIGFGLERITLALLWRYGLELEVWPEEVRERLSLSKETLTA